MNVKFEFPFGLRMLQMCT